MDVAELHAATEDLAGYLSEVTVGDLHRPTPLHSRGIGELIERLMGDNIQFAADIRRRLGAPDAPDVDPARTPTTQHDQTPLTAAPDLLYGGGFETGYRRTAAMVEAAFASVADSAVEIAELYQQRVTDSRQHARDVAASLGLE